MSHDRPQTAKATTLAVGVRNLVGLLSDKGVDPAPLLRRVGLANLDLTKRSLLVPAEAEAALIESAALATGDTAFAIRLAEAINPRDGGLFFYLSTTAATVREALALSARYMRVWNVSLCSTLSETAAGTASMEIRYVGLRRRKLNYAVEYHLVGLIRMLREIAGRPVSPLRVDFAHQRSFGVREFERCFACPVHFGGAADRLLFSREQLDFPLPGADENLHEILRNYADRAAAARVGPMAPLRVAVENEILNLLPGGSAHIDAIADALGLSSRSLSRRLHEEGASFSELLDETRRTMALQYAADPKLSAERIANLLGYGDVAAFRHAFQRWTGRSLSSLRANPSTRAPSADGHESHAPSGAP